MCLEAIENGVTSVSNSKTAKNVSETKDVRRQNIQ